MLNETNFSNGWGIFIVIIVIIIIIWVIVANNSTRETHIHPRPLYDPKTHSVLVRFSLHAKGFKIVEQIPIEDPAAVSKGPNDPPVFITLATFPNDPSAESTRIILPSEANIQNTRLILTNVSDKEEVYPIIITPEYEGCLDDCLSGDDPEEKENCPQICGKVSPPINPEQCLDDCLNSLKDNPTTRDLICGTRCTA